ncbi:MAG: PTS sugar transporter subunit IIA [Gammaproteobacteria bacterium]
MSTGLLIITHNQVGAELLATATAMLGKCPLNARVLPVTTACDPEELQRRAALMIAALEQGGGVIILTDMYGSTPANIAKTLQQAHEQVDVITGINLPMLVRLLNYPHLGRPQLMAKALSGGREGIFACSNGDDGDS